jgi:hypothetical protein
MPSNELHGFIIVLVMDALAKKRRDDDDDEIMLFLLPALYLLGSTREPRQKIPRHTSRLSGKERLEEVLNGHVKDCCVAFRMEPNIFRAIATYLRDEHLLRDTRGIRVEEQFAFFMYMLSHNASYEDMQYQFKHSGETIHRHIKSIFNIIQNLTCKFVKTIVATETHWKISTDPRFFPYFKVNQL